MYLFFDTETTGLPLKGQYNNPNHPQTPKLVELAAVLFDKDGNETGNFTTIIKPYGFEIPVGASNVHKITTEKANAEGIDLTEAYFKFMDLVDKAEFLIAHNASYDKLVMDRVDLDIISAAKFDQGKTILCTKEITTPLCRIPSPYGRGFKWPTLQEAHHHFFNEGFDNAHSALADVRATARVFFHLLTNNLWKPQHR